MTTPGPASSKAAARSAGQTTLAAVQGAQAVNGNTSLLAVTRAALDARTHRRALALCSPAAGGGATTYAASFDARGSEIVTYTTYYDAGCTKPELLEVLTIPASATLSSLTATATVTAFDRAGSVTGYATLVIAESLTPATQTLTLQVSAAKTAGGVPFAQLGLTCSVTLAAASTACGVAAASTAGAPVGVSMALGLTLAGSSTLATVTESISANVYTGSPLGIAQGTGTAWNVTGGTLADTLTGTMTATVGNGSITAGTIALHDTANGLAIAGTTTASGTTLGITQNGTLIATVTVDAAGTGTIAYADGTTETISGWTLLG